MNAWLQLDRLAERHRLFDDHGLVGQLQQPNPPDQVLAVFAFLVVASNSDLSRALTKYKKLSGYRMALPDWPDFPPEGTVAEKEPAYRQQFLVALAGRFRPVQTKDLVAAKSYLKGTQLIDRNSEHWLLDDSLAEIERVLDPSMFIRVSRQWLIRVSAIQSLTRTGQGYVVNLPALAEPITVSRARVSAIKDRLSY